MHRALSVPDPARGSVTRRALKPKPAGPRSRPSQIPRGACRHRDVLGAGNVVARRRRQSRRSKQRKAAKPLTRAQKLDESAESCRKRYAHAKRKRTACEAHGPKALRPQTQNAKHRNAKRTEVAGKTGGRAGRGTATMMLASKRPTLVAGRCARERRAGSACARDRHRPALAQAPWWQINSETCRPISHRAAKASCCRG